MLTMSLSQNSFEFEYIDDMETKYIFVCREKVPLQLIFYFKKRMKNMRGGRGGCKAHLTVDMGLNTAEGLTE